jgi:nucleoside-diphosphate-sugar epimerase
MENWFGSKEQIEEGTLAQPLNPETRLQMIAVDDIGAFVAMAFEHPGHWEQRAIDIAGDELSMTEIAEAFSRSVGREVRYRQVPWDAFEERAGHEITIMYRWFQNVGYHADIAALRQELPSLTSFGRWLNNKWQPAVSEHGRANA